MSNNPLRLPDLNKVLLAGRLTRDPELRYVQSGTALCKFALAVSRKYRTKSGEQREDTLFINVTCWDKTAEYVGETYKKGRPVYVEGKLKSDEWDDKQTGKKRRIIELTADRVQALDWDEKERTPKPEPRAIEEPVPEDDIPF